MQCKQYVHASSTSHLPRMGAVPQRRFFCCTAQRLCLNWQRVLTLLLGIWSPVCDGTDNAEPAVKTRK